MIVLLVTLAMATSQPNPTEDAEAALAACLPSGERAALRCIDLHTPASLKAKVVAQDEPEFSLVFTDDDPMNFLVRAWGAQLRELESFYTATGFPASSSATELLLESYWLRERGCRYNRRERVRVTQEREQIDADISAEFAWAEANDVGLIPSGYRGRGLTVTCSKWRDATR